MILFSQGWKINITTLNSMTKIDFFFVELNLKLIDSLYLGSIGTIKDKLILIVHHYHLKFILVFGEAEMFLIISIIDQ